MEFRGLPVDTAESVSAAAMCAANAGHAFQAVGCNAMFALKHIPNEIVDNMNAVARETLKDEGPRKRLSDLGCRSSKAGVTAE
jgi:hypothetical protein